MGKETELWRFAARKLKSEQTVMLLIVAESTGSSPGRQGFKMIVAENELFGSIGGGVMEIALVEQAQKLKRSGSKGRNRYEIIEQVHRKNSPDSSGMICSGRQTVILYELNAAHLPAIFKVIHTLEKDLPANLRISDSAFEVSEDPPEVFDHRFEKSVGQKFLYREKTGYKNKLFIIGGGHCALALSELMSKLDFYISLYDDREDLNTLAKNGFVQRKIIVDSYENIGEFIESGENVYVVVMTLGYKFDETVIRSLFDKDFKYFGVLGSRAKMRTLLRDLKNDGFDETRLKRIRTPIGIEIHSRTPEEIAVSIAAEIIRVKNSAEQFGVEKV